jgi:hypothetical protein
MPSANRAYASLTRRLVREGRRDLLLPLLEARKAIPAVAVVIDLAERRSDARAATWLRAESLRQRAVAERAIYRIVEEVGDGDCADLVTGLLGGDDRTLADILLDG